MKMQAKYLEEMSDRINIANNTKNFRNPKGHPFQFEIPKT